MCAIAGQADQLKTHSHSFGPMLKHRAGQKCDWSGPKLIYHPSKKKNVIYEIFMHDPAKTSIRNVTVQKFCLNFLQGCYQMQRAKTVTSHSFGPPKLTLSGPKLWLGHICDFSIIKMLRHIFFCYWRIYYYFLIDISWYSLRQKIIACGYLWIVKFLLLW